MYRSGASMQEVHANWRARREEDGWVYGPVKDWGRKTHPCLTDWDKLPEHQKHKEELFRANVMALTV